MTTSSKSHSTQGVRVAVGDHSRLVVALADQLVQTDPRAERAEGRVEDRQVLPDVVGTRAEDAEERRLY
jgi:hypothetical protein